MPSHTTDTRFNNYSEIELFNQKYPIDSCTNITPRITSKLNKQLHNKRGHPLFLTRQRIQNYFYNNFIKSSGNPLFAVFDNISPIVTPYQNFDSLLFPHDHPGRLATDTYYINSKHLLRSHITAHDEELIKMGFNAFLSVGDVFRRDEIDFSHYPAFHQLDGLRLFSEQELFHGIKDPTGLKLFENGNRTNDKQDKHTVDASKLVEFDLKHVLVGITQKLFGKDIKYRWVDCYFPFTHPSWELEIFYENEWMEVLGCGVLEQAIAINAGAGNKVGWAFGIGLDRLAMIQYHIPDIRLLWSEDRRFLDQFNVDNPETKIVYKPISKYMCRQTDISFWITDSFVSSDFYDLVRSVGGDNIERVALIDIYSDVKTARTSHCYTITFQHMERVISVEEVKEIHNHIALLAEQQLGVQIR
ncbi:hypothetical protein HELRODRAFT_68960 [Helobdella robusta]|uniref:Phenylalanine--tRNA ligase, mitochondrial n=1 Tax=Helobdella robusta TaxID=6412 RepID=T1FZM6_HELRO|nr:hypothetical protein HELRODRAFT_68960 [Helobdella robusta]ESN94226.1 hypothetical protein HELRODRAFT_68960 [Helobdella robusta]